MSRATATRKRATELMGWAEYTRLLSLVYSLHKRLCYTSLLNVADKHLRRWRPVLIPVHDLGKHRFDCTLLLPFVSTHHSLLAIGCLLKNSEK